MILKYQVKKNQTFFFDNTIKKTKRFMLTWDKPYVTKMPKTPTDPKEKSAEKIQGIQDVDENAFQEDSDRSEYKKQPKENNRTIDKDDKKKRTIWCVQEDQWPKK